MSSAFQKGKDARFGLRWDHLHVVVGDPADLPDMRPQGEGISDVPLPDELLVKLADLGPRFLDPQIVVSPVRDGPAGHIDQSLHPFLADGPCCRPCRGRCGA